MDTERPLSEDAQYVILTLFPELEANFRQWSQEYQQERDLGSLGEFVGLYRKARKLKTIFIDKVDPSNWRESVRTIALEVAAHALLLVRDLDYEQDAPFYAPDDAFKAAGDQPVTEATRPKGVELGTIIYLADTRRFEKRVPGGWDAVCPPRCSHREGDPLCVAIGKPRG